MDLELTGKVAIVTGGSDGIGKAAAISMAREGARVAIVGRTQGKLDSAVAEIKSETGGEVIGVVMIYFSQTRQITEVITSTAPS